MYLDGTSAFADAPADQVSLFFFGRCPNALGWTLLLSTYLNLLIIFPEDTDDVLGWAHLH